MCNILHFSTTSEEDFTELPRDHFIVKRPREEDGRHLSLLSHPLKWYVACRYDGCSCHFRHYGRFLDIEGALIGCDDATFATAEEDPSADDDEQLSEDTGALYDLFSRILAEGHPVDVLDSWNGEDLHRVRTLDVSLSSVPRAAFRFFESSRFDLRP
jgi:hypothetical protein